MAFIRRVRTASGATAVQIMEYAGGRKQRVVAHVGSAHTEAELGILLQRARALLDDDRQGVLDLGLEPGARAAKLVGPAREPALFAPEPAAGPAGRAAGAAAGPAAGVVGSAQVLGTASAVLFDALAGVFTGLGLDAVGMNAAPDTVFRDLVIARIVEPTSLLDTGRVLTDLGRKPAAYATMKRTLKRCVSGAYRDKVAELCFAHAAAGGDVSLCLYDVTTLYFEAEKEDDLRKVGYSKERRVDPQIVVGLLVDRHGFPLEIGCFEGDKAETATIVPIIRRFQARHGIVQNIVVVADAGMLSASNLRELDEAGFAFIVGSRVTKAPIDLESHFRWHGDAFTDGQVIDTITPKNSRKVENDVTKKAEPVWDPEHNPGSWRAVWVYSAKRAARDNKTLTAQENRARAVVEGDKTARTPRFVKIKGKDRILDDKALARARRLVGLKGYVTNLPAATMPAAQVIADYHDLWHVEQSFRMSKTDLAARPMFHHTRDAIEAHLTIVFTALAVARTVQNRSGLAIRNVIRQLRPLRSATIAINGAVQTFPPAIDPPKQELLDAIGAAAVTH